ncbi:MAG: hypothetical protein ACHQ7M_15285 [Chloroflexota bacterium]
MEAFLFDSPWGGVAVALGPAFAAALVACVVEVAWPLVTVLAAETTAEDELLPATEPALLAAVWAPLPQAARSGVLKRSATPPQVLSKARRETAE